MANTSNKEKMGGGIRTQSVDIAMSKCCERGGSEVQMNRLSATVCRRKASTNTKVDQRSVRLI